MKNITKKIQALSFLLLFFVAATSATASEVTGNIHSANAQTLPANTTSGSIGGVVSSTSGGSQVSGTFGNGSIGGTVSGGVNQGTGGGGSSFFGGGSSGGTTTLVATSNPSPGGFISTTGATTSRPVFVGQVGSTGGSTNASAQTEASTAALTPDVLGVQASAGNNPQSQLAQVAGANVITETGMSIWLWILLLLLLLVLAYTLYKGFSNENKTKTNKY